MKNVLILILSIVVNNAFSQKAPFKVLVSDFEKVPVSGEQILFECEKSGIQLKGVTNDEGFFKIDLPGGETYMIKIKSVGDAMDYSSIEVPAIGENQFYQEGQLTIMIEQSQQFTLNNVHFETGKSTIRSSSYDELDELVEFLKLKDQVKIEIGGHTDNVGEENDNLQLSTDRAKSVKEYLIKKGVSSARLVAKGYGETSPIANNSSENGRSINRRTEVKIISN